MTRQLDKMVTLVFVVASMIKVGQMSSMLTEPPMFMLDGEALHVSRDPNVSWSSQEKEEEILDRHRRYLLYRPMSLLQFTFAYAMPVELMPRRTVNIVLGGQIAYDMPFNLSQLTVQNVARSRPDVPYPHALRAAEIMLDQKGIPGRACMLMAVCQMAETPLEQDMGLMEDILRLLLTPSEGSHPEEWSSTTEAHEYLEAERLGARGSTDCRTAYPECNISLLDAFTRVMLN